MSRQLARCLQHSDFPSQPAHIPVSLRGSSAFLFGYCAPAHHSSVSYLYLLPAYLRHIPVMTKLSRSASLVTPYSYDNTGWHIRIIGSILTCQLPELSQTRSNTYLMNPATTASILVVPHRPIQYFRISASLNGRVAPSYNTDFNSFGIFLTSSFANFHHS
jgi:hypothetical protein